MSKSSSNLNEIVYSGRPKNEEPHVKKSVKRKSERIEYIVRVDLVTIQLTSRLNKLERMNFVIVLMFRGKQATECVP